MRRFVARIAILNQAAPRRRGPAIALAGVLLAVVLAGAACSSVVPADRSSSAEGASALASQRLAPAGQVAAPRGLPAVPLLPPCPPDESNEAERSAAAPGPFVPAQVAGSLAAPTVALSVSSDTGDSNRDRLTGNNTPAFEGLAVAGSTVTLFDNGNLVGVATADQQGKWSYMLNECQGRPDGTHQITAQALDGAGNVSALSPELAITIQTNAPAQPVITSPAQNGHARSSLVIAGTAAPGVTIRVLEGNAERGRGRSNGKGAWSVSLNGVAAGKHAFRASAVDAAGNESPAFNLTDVTVDPAGGPVGLVQPVLVPASYVISRQAAVQQSAALQTATSATVSFQNSVLPNTSYAGATDTYLSQANPTSNYGTATSCRMDGDDPPGTGLDLSCLLRWDISAIPAGSTVSAASITVYVSNTSVNQFPLYQVLRPWVETQATWQLAVTGQAWGAPGATGSTDRGSTVLGALNAPAIGFQTLTLNSAGIAVVQGWVDTPSSNQGVILADTSMTDGLDFLSDSHPTLTQRPKLTIQYTTGSTSATATPTATTAPATSTPTATSVAATSTPTATSQPATDTPTATSQPATDTPTATSQPATATPAATTAPATDTPTATSAPATSTPTATSLPPTPTATATPLPPTPTATATPLPPTPTATATPPPPTPTATATATATSAPIVALAGGDIACGTGSGGDCQQLATAKLLTANNPSIVIPLGDNQYECGSLSDFQNYYGPSWGVMKAKTYPSIGNHEYQVDSTAGQPCYGAPAGAPGYYTYFGTAASPRQPNCTSGCQGYYSYDAGSWHIVVLNSVCSQVGGCGLGSAQETWLKNDLAAHPSQCTLAYWHYPRFTSGLSGTTFLASMKAFWQDLYNAGADLILTGHDHDYERFAPMDANGNLDTAHGIRQIIVGTGGKSHQGFTSTAANSQVRNSDTFGVLKLTLGNGSYSWQFLPVSGKTFTDSGNEACR